MAARCVIAHLSDLHFGNHDQNVLNRLSDDLLRPPRPDFLVVTGDLSERAKDVQLKAAKKYLDEILGQLSRVGHNMRYLVIPGNHDVGRDKRQKTWRQVFPTGAWGSGAEKGLCQPANLYDHHFDRTKNGQEAKQLVERDTRYCEYYPHCQTAFLKFNSNILMGRWWDLPLLGKLDRTLHRLTCGWWNYGNGGVGAVQLNRARETVARYEEAFSDFKHCRRVALVHHHIHFLPDGDLEKWLLMDDAGPFWKAMIDLGVELVLHGHKHYATHAVIRYLRGRDGGGVEEREFMVLAGGTAASHDLPPNQQHCYYRIECDDFKCKAQKRAYGENAFGDAGPPLVFRSRLRFQIPEAGAGLDTAALETMVVTDDEDMDANHYKKITYEATIDRNLGYSMQIRYEGSNTSKQTFLRVPVVIVGAPGRRQQVQWEAHDAATNASLHYEVEPHTTNVDKLWLRVSFPGDGHSGAVSVRIGVTVPALMWPKNDFDAVGLARFVGGVEQFEYVLRSEREVREPKCFAVERSQLRQIDLNGPSVETVGDKRYYTFRPQCQNPAELGLGLLFHYRELRTP